MAWRAAGVVALLTIPLFARQPDPAHVPVPASQPGQPVELPQGINAPPPVTVTPPIIDFGILTPGKPAPATVTLKNTGDKVLVLEESIPSCSCTHVTASRDSIGPGEEMEVVFELDGTYKLGKPVGPKAIYFRFGGYFEPVKVEIYYEVAYPVRMTPAFYNDQYLEKNRTGEFTVESLDQRPFRILRIAGRPPVYADGFDPAKDQPRNKYQVKWDFTNQKYQPWMMVETDHPAAPIVEMDMLCEEVRQPERDAAKGDIHVRPGGWNFGLFKGAETKTYEIRAKNIDPGQFPRITTPFTQDVTVKIASTPPKPSTRKSEVGYQIYTLEVTPRAGYEGLLLTPIYYHYKDQQYRTWIFGRVEKSDSAAAMKN